MKCPPFRTWIGVMIFFTTFTNYMLRSNMSVSIIKMVGAKKMKHIPVCRVNKNQTVASSNKTSQEKVFDWNENEVGDIMAAYFYGYLVSLVPAGMLAEMLGPFHVIFWSSVLSAILTGLTPLSAEQAGHTGVVINRVIVGILGGVVYPAVNVLMAKWAPPKEKGKFMAAMMGNTLGTVVVFNLVGVVTDFWGWAWGFYVLVFIMIVFCFFFFFIVADTPDKSRWTSQEERDYIMEAQEGHVSKKKAVAPYKKMLTSVPFIALIIAQFGSLWILNLILTYAPKFMSETLDFNLKASAGLASLPYLARLISSAIFGNIGDYLRRNNIMTVTHLRKFFIIFSHFIPAVCCFLIRAAGCNQSVVVALIVLNQGFNGAVVVSQLVNPQDLAPNFTGSLFGMMNVFAMTTGIIVPKITGALNTAYNRDLTAAFLIFLIGGIVCVVTGVIFILFGSGEVQSWNEIKEEGES